MSHELFFTSAAKGLRPGSRGFCTVAATQGLPLPLAEKVESLSGYRPLYPPLDARANRNPVAHSHLRVSVGGKTYSVLSRISPAGLDYSQRANKFAHHVILEAAELPAAGPAWLLSQPGFLESQWDGEVRVIPSGRLPPQGDQGPAVCRRWQELTGDAGWGGVLADWFERDAYRQVYVIVEPGMDLLPLIAETIALLPPERRWQVSLSTYFTGLPQDIPCLWRCVIKDSPEAGNASRLRGQQVLNLCEPLGQAPAGKFVEQARTGRMARLVSTAATAVAAKPESFTDWPGKSEVAVPGDDQGTFSMAPAWKRASNEVEATQEFPQKSSSASTLSTSAPLSRVGGAREPRGPAASNRGKYTWLWVGLGGLICGLGSGMLLPLLWRASAVSVVPSPSSPKENGAGALAADEKEIRNLEKEVEELNQKNQAKDKEFKEINATLVKTKKALAQETEKRAQLEREKKEKEKTIAELQDELRKEKESRETSKALQKTPAARFMVAGYLRLPEWSRSGFNESKLKIDRDIKAFGLDAGQDYRLKLLVIDPAVLEPIEGVSSIKVRFKGGEELAKFELNEGKLSFQWQPQAEDKYERAQALLRDCVLEIGSAGKTRYLALRKPIYEKEMEVVFPGVGIQQDVYRNTGDFMAWDDQGRPSQELLFDSVRIEIDNKEQSLKPQGVDKRPIQMVFFGDSVKQFRWGVIGQAQESKHVGSLTLGPSNPLRKPSRVRITSLSAYIEVQGVYVEVARIGKAGKK